MVCGEVCEWWSQNLVLIVTQKTLADPKVEACKRRRRIEGEGKARVKVEVKVKINTNVNVDVNVNLESEVVAAPRVFQLPPHSNVAQLHTYEKAGLIKIGQKVIPSGSTRVWDHVDKLLPQAIKVQIRVDGD